MSSMMEEFIQYAKEQFGYNISFDKSSMPDTFESLFGMSFIDQTEKIDFGGMTLIVLPPINTQKLK